MKRWLGFWLLCCCGLSSAWAQDVRTRPVTEQLEMPMQRAWWRDPAGAAQLVDLPRQPFKPFTGALSLGNSEDVVWIRLALPALSGQDGQWVLLLQPAMLQEAQIFVQNPDGSWQHQALGLAHAFAKRPLSFLNVAYPLAASPQSRQAYIRLKTVTSAFKVQLLPATQAQALDGTMHGGIGLYVGLTLVFTLLSLVCWMLTHDRLWGLIGLFDVSSLVLMSLQMGAASRYVLPEVEGVMNHALVLAGCTHMAVLMPLSYYLARHFCSHRWVSWPYVLVLMAYPVELLLIWRGQEAVVQATNNIGAILLSLWALVVGAMFDVKDRLLRWSCRTLYWTLGLYVVYYLTPLVTRIPPPAALHFYPAMPSNLITMMFSAVMLMRATQQAREARLDEQRRLLAERELDLSRRQHEETSGLLSMLLHEIRTPLALIQTATRALLGGRASDTAGLQKMTQRIDDAVLNISGVLERCIEVDRLEHDRLTPLPEQLDAAHVLREWLHTRPAHHRIQLSAPAQLPACLDPQLWLSMVANLLQNALKYSPPESLIQLHLRQEGGRVVLTVSNQVGDAGQPDAGKLFQKYYRSDRAARISGTGLGLYWVKVLSQRLGGDVRYLPPPESTHTAPPPVVFCLMLPVRSASAAGAAAQRQG
jgi:signal transduction histidine kinase